MVHRATPGNGTQQAAARKPEPSPRINVISPVSQCVWVHNALLGKHRIQKIFELTIRSLFALCCSPRQVA